METLKTSCRKASIMQTASPRRSSSFLASSGLKAEAGRGFPAAWLLSLHIPDVRVCVINDSVVFIMVVMRCRCDSLPSGGAAATHELRFNPFNQICYRTNQEIFKGMLAHHTRHTAPRYVHIVTGSFGLFWVKRLQS